MLFLFIFLWTIAAILIISNPKNSKTRWGSAVAFFSGFGGLAVVLDKQIRPTISDTYCLGIIDVSISFIDTLSYYVAPYTFFVFCLVFLDIMENKLKKYSTLIKLVLFLPVLMMHILYPVAAGFKPSYHVLSAWAAPYVIGGNLMLIYYCFNTRNPKIRKQIIIGTFLVLPPTMFSIITNYLSSIFNVYNVWQYNVWIIGFLFVSFIIISVKFGALNIRVRLEKNRFANLESIVDNISEGFIVIDESNYIIEMNKSFIKYFGEMDIGEEFLKAITGNEALLCITDKLSEAIVHCCKEKQPVSIEDLVFLKEQGKSFSVDITPIFERKKFVGVVILFRDITELKNNIFLLEKNQSQIIENERLSSLGQLIGGVSHNLRTPLMASSGGIDILLDITNKINSEIEQSNISEDDKKHYFEKITEMLRWEDHIKNYLSYMSSVITTIKGQVSPIDDSKQNYFSVRDLTKGIDILMKHEFKKASVIIKYNIDVDESLMIPGNINYLLQVMDNLIVNAIDSYVDKKGEKVELSIFCMVENEINIVVRDYGKGISEGLQSKLFKQMVTTKGKNGTGLGLYISKSIITSKFGGEIEFESEVGVGSVFTIRLPL